ncbi:MAG: apolipoprotein N-acyltransferase [bacterium]
MSVKERFVRRLREDHWFRLFLALIGAVCLGLSFPTWSLVLLVVPGLGFVYLAVTRANTWESFRHGFAFGSVFFLVHAYWFYSFHPVALVGVMLIAGLWYGGWGAITRWWGASPWTATVSWIVLEWGMGQGYLAFPWSRVSTVLSFHPLFVQPVRWVGELIWGGLFVLGSVLLAECIVRNDKKRRCYTALGGTVVVLLALFVSGATYENNQRLETFEGTVGLFQPNVASRRTLRRTGPSQLEVLYRQTVNNRDRLDIVVWPETSVSGRAFSIDNDALVWNSAHWKQYFRDLLNGKIPLVTGAVVYDRRPGALDKLNGVVQLDSRARPGGFYTKRYPVPGGEHLPYMGQLDWVHKLGKSFGTLGFRPGRSGCIVNLRLGDRTIPTAVQICYEDIFSGYVRNQVHEGADLLLNVSNDSWSRSESAHWQHFYRARLRAIETGRTVLRNGNTGVTAIIDPLGYSHKLLSPYTRGVAKGSIYKPLKVPFYGQWGDWITLLFLVLLVGFRYIYPV